jgi:hypothetical protein
MGGCAGTRPACAPRWSRRNRPAACSGISRRATGAPPRPVAWAAVELAGLGRPAWMLPGDPVVLSATVAHDLPADHARVPPDPAAIAGRLVPRDPRESLLPLCGAGDPSPAAGPDLTSRSAQRTSAAPAPPDRHTTGRPTTGCPRRRAPHPADHSIFAPDTSTLADCHVLLVDMPTDGHAKVNRYYRLRSS